MATAPSLLADREEPVHRTRHRAAHEQEIPLRVHLHDPQAQLGEAPRAHMARHALSLDDARGVGARGDRAGLAVARVAVRLRPTPPSACPAGPRRVRWRSTPPNPRPLGSPAPSPAGRGPASIPVPGPAAPSASKTRVMPSFLPISPVIPTPP